MPETVIVKEVERNPVQVVLPQGPPGPEGKEGPAGPPGPPGPAEGLEDEVAILNLGTDWSAGDNQSMYAAGILGLRQNIEHGSSGSPITTVGPTAKFSRREALTVAAIEAAGGAGTDGADQVAALMGISVGQDPSETQTVGGAFFAINSSNFASGNPDACGLYAVGRIPSGTAPKATAIGGFFAARRDVSTADVNGVEITCHNRGEASSYASAGASSARGIWLHATGTADSGCAINLGNPFSRKYEVGFGIPLQNGGAISKSSYRDDGEAEFSLDVRGKHSKGALRVLSPAAGAVVIGHSELATANALLEVMNDESGRDPIAVVGSVTAAQKYSTMIRNSLGSARMFVGGSADDFFAGSAAGDTGISFTAGKAFRIGAVGKTHKITVTEGGLSFYGVAPVARHAAVAEPAETLASLKAAVNGIRDTLQKVGLTE